MDSVINVMNQLSDYYNLKVDVLKKDINCYRAIIDFKNSMGEVIVHQPDFAPYRFVRIEILSSLTDEFDQIYVWGDKDGDDIQTIISHIKQGISAGNKY